MSLLRRTIPLIDHRSALLRVLLEKLSQNEATAAILKEAIEALPDMKEDERRRMLANPAEYLFPPPAPSSVPKMPATKPEEDFQNRIMRSISRSLLNIDPPEMPVDHEKLRTTVHDLLNAVVEEEGQHLSRSEKERLVERVLADVIGYGVIDGYVRDDTVTEIRVLGPKQIYIVRKGHFEAVPVTFDDENAVLRVIDRMTAPAGIRLDETNPMAQIRLPDGSQATLIIRPLAQQGPSLYIHKYFRHPLQLADLLRFGTLTQEAAEFLHAAVITGLSLVITGSTRGGKTTLMNALAETLPQDWFITMIEKTTELWLHLPQVLSLQTRPPNIEGKGEVTPHQLAEYATQFHPDYVLLSSTEGRGLLPLLETVTPLMVEVTAWNSLAALQTLQTALLVAQPGLLEASARELLADRLHLVVEIRQLRDGSRKVTSIAELQPDGSLMPLFEFEQIGEEKSRVIGRLREVGNIPRCVDRIKDAGIQLPIFRRWYRFSGDTPKPDSTEENTDE